MPGLKPALFAALALALSPLARGQGADCDKLVVAADPSYPPLHWYDGKVMRGASVDVAVRVLRELGLPFEVRYVGPWKRVLLLAQMGKVDVVTTLKITPERERYLRFTSRPAFDNPVAVFVARERPVAFAAKEDLIGWRGGIAAGNKFGAEVDDFIAGHLQIEQADTADINFRKLAAGRIDYLITGLYTGQAYIAAHGQESLFQPLLPYLAQTTNYIAFSRASACSKHLQAFDQRLTRLIQSGGINPILAESLQQWRVNPAPLRHRK